MERGHGKYSPQNQERPLHKMLSNYTVLIRTELMNIRHKIICIQMKYSKKNGDKRMTRQFEVWGLHNLQFPDIDIVNKIKYVLAKITDD